MRLVFKKENSEYTTFIEQDAKEIEFNYVTFVKLICLGSTIESPSFVGDITEEERQIITDFIDDIRKRVDENKKGLPTPKKGKISLPPNVKRDQFMEK